MNKLDKLDVLQSLRRTLVEGLRLSLLNLGHGTFQGVLFLIVSFFVLLITLTALFIVSILAAFFSIFKEWTPPLTRGRLRQLTGFLIVIDLRLVEAAISVVLLSLIYFKVCLITFISVVNLGIVKRIIVALHYSLALQVVRCGSLNLLRIEILTKQAVFAIVVKEQRLLKEGAFFHEFER